MSLVPKNKELTGKKVANRGDNGEADVGDVGIEGEGADDEVE